MSDREFTEGDLLYRHELAGRLVRHDSHAARELIRAYADRHNVTYDEMMGRSRLAVVSAARHAVWLELRRLGWSLPQIARLFQRDHTTVLYGVRAAQRELKETA